MRLIHQKSYFVFFEGEKQGCGEYTATVYTPENASCPSCLDLGRYNTLENPLGWQILQN